MSTPDLTVVLPVRDAAHLVTDCLRSVVPELTSHDARCVVVDDGSTDDTPGRLEPFDVTVLRHQRPLGPYAARNTGWHAADTPWVVFLDVRCRVRPGWLSALRAAGEAPDVAIAGAGYVVRDGPTLAERLAHREQGFSAHVSLGDRLPFLPGGNLLVARRTLELLGGFDERLRSGGDLVLCWRAQLEGLGRVVAAPGAEVDWVPRAGVRSLLRQRARYGRARPTIVAGFADHGLVPPPPGRIPSLGQLRALMRDVAAHRGAGLAEDLLAHVAGYAYHRAYRSAWKRLPGHLRARPQVRASGSDPPGEPGDEG